MSFITIPKVLFMSPQYQSLSAEAKLLYGLLDDRSSLSKKNGDAWKNKYGDYFVYFKQEEIMTKLGCGHDKATKLVRELEKAELIKRIPQGLGKPHMLIVKEVLQTADNKCRGLSDDSDLDCEDFASINTEKNAFKTNYTDTHYSKSIVAEMFKENISFDVLIKELDKDLLDCVVAVVTDAICSPGESVKIAGEQRDRNEVFSRFMRINDLHIRYIADRINHEKSPLYSPRGYLLKHLFEAEESIELYYQTRVAHDENKRRSYYG